VARTSRKARPTHDASPNDCTSPLAYPAVAPASKIAQVVIMLERPVGASLGDLAEQTGWQPHTTRAALTGLRKKGHVIGKESRGGVTVYSVVKAAL
jgi:hypothetical protein